MKYKSQFLVTNEVIKELLGMPKEVNINYVTYSQDREIVTLHLSSETEVPYYTLPTHEGATIAEIDSEEITSNAEAFRMKIYEQVRDNLVFTLPEGEDN
jgi:hypothetical protein